MKREAVAASLGCGNPTALVELEPGETVLDLGSGGGIDVLLSARRCLKLPLFSASAAARSVASLGRGELSQLSGLCAREVRGICNGKVIPLANIRDKLRCAAAEYARAQLGHRIRPTTISPRVPRTWTGAHNPDAEKV